MNNTADKLNSLRNELIELLGNDRVYCQPPANFKLTYPCIIFKRNSADTKFANNMPYNFDETFEVTIIDANPYSDLVRKMAFKFKHCRYSRHFTSDNLNHDVFIINY